MAIEPQKGHRLPGLKNLEESKPPGILDRSVIDEVIRVTDEPACPVIHHVQREGTERLAQIAGKARDHRTEQPVHATAISKQAICFRGNDVGVEVDVPAGASICQAIISWRFAMALASL